MFCSGEGMNGLSWGTDASSGVASSWKNERCHVSWMGGSCRRTDGKSVVKLYGVSGETQS